MRRNELPDTCLSVLASTGQLMRMRSMSVSDVLVVNRGGKKTAYYVDSFGFQEVKQFFKQKAPKKNERQPTKRKCALER